MTGQEAIALIHERAWTGRKPGLERTQALLAAAAEGCYMTGVGNASGNSVAIAYDAVVSPVSNAVTNTGVASVIFTMEWDI